jgi:hypothetical protein
MTPHHDTRETDLGRVGKGGAVTPRRALEIAVLTAGFNNGVLDTRDVERPSRSSFATRSSVLWRS